MPRLLLPELLLTAYASGPTRGWLGSTERKWVEIIAVSNEKGRGGDDNEGERRKEYLSNGSTPPVNSQARKHGEHVKEAERKERERKVTPSNYMSVWAPIGITNEPNRTAASFTNTAKGPDLMSCALHSYSLCADGVFAL